MTLPLMAGAADAQRRWLIPTRTRNDCYRYAAARNLLLRGGRAVELMVSYEPCFHAQRMVEAAVW